MRIMRLRCAICPRPRIKQQPWKAALTFELAEGDRNFTYRLLGDRLQKLKERKESSDAAEETRLRALEEIAGELARTKDEPSRLSLPNKGEYELFTVLRANTSVEDEKYIADCARRMVGHLRAYQLLTPGWSNSKGGRMRIEQSLLVESWNPAYTRLGFAPDDAEPPFLRPALEELARADSQA
jgi:type I restriction enzyme R subunit